MFVAATGFETEAEKEGWVLAWNGQAWGRVDGLSWRNPGFPQTDDHPVVAVSYNDAAAFCTWLSDRSGRHIHSPTEAQWEYACRAGTTTLYEWGDAPDGGKGRCNGADLSAKKAFPRWKVFEWDDGYVFTSPVRAFKPNGFGLHDMQGNAWQWCADWYDAYPHEAQVDPTGPTSGLGRALRGGSWGSGPVTCRSAARHGGHMPDSRCDDTGFRVAAVADRE